LELAPSSIGMGGEEDTDGAADAQRADEIFAWVESYRVWILYVFALFKKWLIAQLQMQG